ncbi:hypothetical protein SETIT_1G022100v2 [Setaria italica]|uniref:DUF6817 domain-containing protein n=1 Tax=Setaria italica TaxID=4555 RepID=K3Z118_SETIT|nr:uncharacterized protein LOC101767640 [Setaria italica]RCV04701.1 hypothetical protein SETIT_1G022100v2 [Setaria italica]
MATVNKNMIVNGVGNRHHHDDDDEQVLPSLLAAARPFLRGELGAADPELPSLVSVLRAAGAGECYHKHGTFLAHLVDVYRILRLWGAPGAVARCGLFHSSYSNSYVNLAIFQPDTGRDRVRGIVGAPAERLVHLFCVVPRHQIIHDDLLFHYTDQELRDHLAASQAAVDGNAASTGQELPAWRRKLRSLVPVDGVVARHIRTGEPVALSRRVVAAFLLMTVADFSDQYTDYQDELFGNEDGRLEFSGDNWAALWPGTGKPGLWVSAMSRMTALYNLIARDDQLLLREGGGGKNVEVSDDDMLVGEMVVPPVFEGCTRVLDPEEQKAARDLYWAAICGGGGKKAAEGLLRESVRRNPFVGEPWLVLAQVLLNEGGGRYEEAAAAAARGVRLLLEWGSSWDKRMSWEGWVSWGRLMRDKAKRREWPRTAWGIINLGLVDGVANCN